MPAISAVRTTSRNVRLAAEADATVPAGTALNPDLRLVVHQLLQGSGALVAICATNAPFEGAWSRERAPGASLGARRSLFRTDHSAREGTRQAKKAARRERHPAPYPADS